MTEPKRRINLGTVLIRADRKWAADNAADIMLADHMGALIRALQEHTGTLLVDDTRHEVANLRVLLGRMVKTITGGWDPDGDIPKQATEALRQLRVIESFLRSLHEEQGAA